jgi:hypothetical protein
VLSAISGHADPEALRKDAVRELLYAAAMLAAAEQMAFSAVIDCVDDGYGSKITGDGHALGVVGIGALVYAEAARMSADDAEANEVEMMCTAERGMKGSLS